MGMEALVGLGLAASAAGTGVSMASAARARRDMNKQINTSLLQQKRFQQQATPVVDERLADRGAKKSKQTIRDAAAAAKQGYEESQIAGGQSPLPQDQGQGAAFINQQRETAAQHEGYNEERLQNWLKDANSNRQLRVISDLARSAAGTAPILTSLAGNRSANMGAIGSLMTTAGNLAGIYGSIKANTPTAATSRNTGLVN